MTTSDLLPAVLDGQLLREGTAEHEAARTRNFALNAHLHDDDNDDIDNVDIDDHSAEGPPRRAPSYIAVVKSVQDVQECMRFANRHKLTVSVRTGGHNWFGCYLRQNRGANGGRSSSPSTLLIDLHHLNHIGEVDPVSHTVAAVGPGARGQEVNRLASEHGLCFSSGHCVGVSLGGYLLGGGLGWFAPHFGYASESVVRMTVVDAAGNLVEVVDDGDCNNNYDQEGKDWMWLARGSACAFPGIVVAFTLRLHPLPPVIRTKAEFYPLQDYEAILRHVYQYATRNAELASKTEVALVLTETPSHLTNAAQLGPFVVLFKLSVMASSEEELEAILAPLCGDSARFPSVPFQESTFQSHGSFESLPETTRLAYPPGHHWLCRSYIADLDRFDSMDWFEFRRAFVENAPVSPGASAAVSTLVHATVLVAPERPVSAPGCYGRCTPGITVLVSGAYQGTAAESSQTDRDAKRTARTKLQGYADALHALLDPSFASRYNAVEHPVHRGTFPRAFPDGGAEQIVALRSRLDPEGVLWDPSSADPYS